MLAHGIALSLTIIMIVFLGVHSFQALLLAMAAPELWSHWQLADDEYFHALVGSEALPPISVIATLHGDHHDPVRFATMLLELEYPRHEVVLVSDDASREMLATLTDAFELYEVPPAFAVSLRTRPVRAYYRSRTQPRLLLVDKERGGRGDAMNAGMNAARYPHALAVGGNLVFERDALLRLSRPFLLDRSVAAVASTLRPANGAYVEGDRLVPGTPRGWLLGSQTIEYLRNFRFQRLGWNRLASNLLFPGNTAIFKREHVFALGGFRPDAPHPGLDLAVRLHRHLADTGVNPRMPVIPDQVAWTLIPEQLAAVGRARQGWQVGLRAALRENLALTGNPEYGSFGVLAVPYFWLAILALPYLELAGYVLLAIAIAIGAVGAQFVTAYLAAVLGYGILLSVWTVILQAVASERTGGLRDVGRLFFFAVVESLGYRQAMQWYRATAFFADRTPTPNHG
jgi:cellulose synthase/poly-beta-1,6-N-acetylglucosamine synthase-like glycosyltransferase